MAASAAGEEGWLQWVRPALPGSFALRFHGTGVRGEVMSSYAAHSETMRYPCRVSSGRPVPPSGVRG
jgi:hypothetical protein